MNRIQAENLELGDEKIKWENKRHGDERVHHIESTNLSIAGTECNLTSTSPGWPLFLQEFSGFDSGGAFRGQIRFSAQKLKEENSFKNWAGIIFTRH